jgi:hypothetical protein
MTERQRLVLKAGLVVAAVAGLFPPWQVDMAAAGSGVSGIVRRGHHFILGVSNGYWRIDYAGLFVSWIVIALVTGAVFVFVGDRSGTQR